jgi:hypothetical protein
LVIKAEDRRCVHGQLAADQMAEKIEAAMTAKRPGSGLQFEDQIDGCLRGPAQIRKSGFPCHLTQTPLSAG